ncbi:MAG TPA: phosphotransferase [Acidimicrobiia bacterium]|nr:phosphotransferase [Acidimicrobiia bacterium]
MLAPEVPDSLDVLLDPAWLTAALGLRFPGIEVVSVTRGPVVERLSTNARFRIECAGGMPDGLVPTLCAKGYFCDAGRPIAYVGEPEARFYRDLAEASGVHTLRSVYADVHPETRHGVVITEDVIEAGGRFLDALSPYSPDQVAVSLEELARLHAHTWGDASWAREPWLAPRLHTYLQQRGVNEIRKNFEGAPGRDVPDDVRVPERMMAAFQVLAAREFGRGWAVVHGDAHVGNLFVDADERPGLVDWQVVQCGHWAIDVGYHVASALEPPERAAHERALLGHYLAALASHGIEAPDPETAWREYRCGVAYGLFMWAITLFVHPAIIETLVRRLGIAAHELDSFGALGV